MQDTEIKEKLKGAAGKLERLFRGYFRKYIESEEEKPLTKRSGILKGIGSGVLGYLFAGAELWGGVSPFGVAFLCSAERSVYYIYLGLMLSALINKGGLARLVSYSVALVIRILLCRVLGASKKKGTSFTEPSSVKMATSSAAVFIIGIYNIIGSGFTKGALYSALLMTVIAPTMTYLYLGITEQGAASSARHDAGVLSLIYTLVLSFSGFGWGGSPFSGFSPNTILASAITLCASAGGGAFRGGAVGMISGLACGTEVSVALGIAGVVSGILKNSGTLMTIFAFCGTGTAFSLVGEGFSTFGGTVPDILFGAAIFAPISKLGLLPKVYKYISLAGGEGFANSASASRAIYAERYQKETGRKLSALSEALSSLSTVFYTLSNRISTPGTYEVRRLCESTFKRFCERCGKSTLCWAREYDRTADAINKLANATAKHGVADSSDIPKDFFQKCPNVLSAISEINLSHARLLEAAARENKTEIFALDYEAMAKLLESSCTENSEEYSCDKELTERVRRAAHDMNLLATGIGVFGKRRKNVVFGGVDISCVPISSAEICKLLSSACGVKLTIPEFTIDDDYVTMTASSARVISIESAKASMKKDAETLNGDSVTTFSNKEDYFYSIISDGMGSGRDAAITSRITCIFLEKMLLSGNKMSLVLKMLNNFIRNKNLECFATVDLLEIDLLSASASFIKSGAAASYVVRDRKLFKIFSSSLPIGITREITAEEIKFSLKPEDVIIMISDGISQSFEDGVWLADLLSSGIDYSLRLDDIAGIILEAAKSNNKRSDDMTVSVIRIKEA